MDKYGGVWKYRVMGKYEGMEVSGTNMGAGDNGGNVGSGVPRPPLLSHQPSRSRPRPPSRPRPH